MNLVNDRKLTVKQTALVDTIVANGCSITEAATQAGYAKGESKCVQGVKAPTCAAVHDAKDG